MSEEDWDKEEYACQTSKIAATDSTAGNSLDQKEGGRGRGKGNSRARFSRGGNMRGGRRGRDGNSGSGEIGSGDHVSNSDIRGRGGSRGRGIKSDLSRNNDSNNRNGDGNSFVRNRGRGRSFRGNHSQRKGLSKAGSAASDNENSDHESDKPNGDRRTSRGLTPPRGARGRTRSSSGRFCERTPERKDESHPRGRGRGRGRGHGRIIVSRSDGEDSEGGSDDGNNLRRGNRGRRRLTERSKSFRGGPTSGGRGSGRGGQRGGRGKYDEEEVKRLVKYIPPEPTEDEEIIFHSGITTGVHFNKYDTITVDVTGEKPPTPTESFEAAGLRKILLENIQKSDYKKPTPVQKNSIPIISEGRDLMACAQTGSGKTAAFLIPLINDLLSWTGELVTGQCIEPLAVVLSPTRELSIQIFQEARKFAHGSTLKIALIYGGTVSQHQLDRIRKGCHILVAVPGRLESFVKAGHIKFSSVRFFVLDEADRMLELGFVDSVKRMLAHESMTKIGVRRTLMFSATFPQEIQEMASQYLHNYLFLAVGEVGGACSDVQQLFHEVSQFDKRDKLVEILQQDRSRGDNLTLVFVGMKRHADFLAVYLCDNNIPTTSIHGDRYQSQREEALADFKSGKRPTLIATAVAARGLDIKNVAHVINYDLPSTIEEYVHRIGRTGRVGNCGKSTSFYDKKFDQHLSKNLVRILKQANQPVPDFLESDASASNHSESFVDKFSSTDIRTANSDRAGTSAVADDEECWD